MQTFAMVIAMLLFGGLSIWALAAAAFTAWAVGAGFGHKSDLVIPGFLLVVSAGLGWLAVQVAPFTINVT